MTTPGKELLYVSLGGSGEIGMNLNLYGCDGKWLMLDLGVTFGNADYPGIDIIMPDTAFIEERRKDLVGIVLTHGHEDHGGAVAYLAADLGVPIYCNKFTAGIVNRKIAEEGVERDVKLTVVDTDAEFDIGPFGIKLIPLAHSIPDMCAAVISTPYGTIFHSGDWKLDEDPVLGLPQVEAAIRPYGDAGILALVCDSTNVFNNDPSGSEGSVREGLHDVVDRATGRVIVTTFASNAARLQTLGEVAKATGRELCVAGRSLDKIIEVSRSCGYLKTMPNLITPDEAMRLPRNKVMVIATGGQGEPRAALARIAEGSHPIKLDAGDTVVYSSKQIPGNEMAIGRIMNKLAESGIKTVTEKQAHIHVSGHPGKPELAAMYRWVRPQIIVPVHGEMRHMQEQARFAMEQGVPQSVVQRNGQLVRLAPGKPKIISEVENGRLVLDGDMIVRADGGSVNARRKLAVNGQIAVAVASGKVDISVQGLPIDPDDMPAFRAAVTKAALSAGAGNGDINKRREAIRIAVRRVCVERTGKKAIVDILLPGAA